MQYILKNKVKLGYLFFNSSFNMSKGMKITMRRQMPIIEPIIGKSSVDNNAVYRSSRNKILDGINSKLRSPLSSCIGMSKAFIKMVANNTPKMYLCFISLVKK